MGALIDDLRTTAFGITALAIAPFALFAFAVAAYHGLIALFAARADQRRAEAMRRLGGPDLDKERRENAMSGDQKMWVMLVMSGAALLGWVVWNIMTYYTAAAALAARTRPSPASMLTCVNRCAESCMGQDIEGVHR